MYKKSSRHGGSEHAEQVLLFGLAKLMEPFAPELKLLFAIPNGAKLPYRGKGKSRFSAEALRLKDEGLKPGVPDVFLPVPRNGKAGMWIEMKFERNYLTDEQRGWCVSLLEQGYRVDVCYSAEDALKALCNYLGVEPRFINR